MTSNSNVVRIRSETFANGSTQGSLSLKAYANTNNTEVMCFLANGQWLDPIIRLIYKILIQGMKYVYDFSVYALSIMCINVLL